MHKTYDIFFSSSILYVMSQKVGQFYILGFLIELNFTLSTSCVRIFGILTFVCMYIQYICKVVVYMMKL